MNKVHLQIFDDAKISKLSTTSLDRRFSSVQSTKSHTVPVVTYAKTLESTTPYATSKNSSSAIEVTVFNGISTEAQTETSTSTSSTETTRTVTTTKASITTSKFSTTSFKSLATTGRTTAETNSLDLVSTSEASGENKTSLNIPTSMIKTTKLTSRQSYAPNQSSNDLDYKTSMSILNEAITSESSIISSTNDNSKLGTLSFIPKKNTVTDTDPSASYNVLYYNYSFFNNTTNFILHIRKTP